jgi:hypothetical protein
MSSLKEDIIDTKSAKREIKTDMYCEEDAPVAVKNSIAAAHKNINDINNFDIIFKRLNIRIRNLAF